MFSIRHRHLQKRQLFVLFLTISDSQLCSPPHLFTLFLFLSGNPTTYLKHIYHTLLLLLCCLQQTLFAQQLPAFDEQAFRAMSPSERYRFVHDVSFSELDSAGTAAIVAMMRILSLEQKDTRSALAANFRRYKDRMKFGTSQSIECHESMLVALSEMETLGSEKGCETEALVGHIYYTYELYNYKRLPPEAMYVDILQSFEKMQAIGFGKFRDYQLDQIFYFYCHFMMGLEDYEEAYRFLVIAEGAIQPDGENYEHYTLFLNYLQYYWTRKKNYEKAIGYAWKIIRLYENLHAKDDPDFAWRSHFWLGFSRLSIATLLDVAGQTKDVEFLADEGYRSINMESPGDNLEIWLAEYDALQAYIPIKMKFGRMEEAGRLLQQAETIRQQYGNCNGFNDSKHISHYKNYARYHELQGDATEALRYTKLAQVLQDSLDLRNDARKFENIRHRLNAEKYAAQLRLLESEKELQKWLRNAAFVILALLLALAWAWFHRQQHLRQQEQNELEAAKNALGALTQSFREKSDMAEKLRSEMDDLAARGERSQHLEQLTQSVLLTEAHWTQFRALFEQVHPGFLEAQKTANPQLTPAELRFLALEKLGLGYQEMANMLGVSLQTVYKTGQRMRKKSQS